MFENLTIQALKVPKPEFETLKTSTEKHVYTNLNTYFKHRNSNAMLPLAIGTVLSSAKFGKEIYVCTKRTTRYAYSTARLTVNGDYNHDIVQEATRRGYSSVEGYLHVLLTENIQSQRAKNADMSIYIIEAPSGITNISKLMAANKIPEIKVPLQQNKQHAIRVYKIEQYVYIITNEMYDSTVLFMQQIVGALPIIYNEIFKGFDVTIPYLYEYFKNCFEKQSWDTILHTLQQNPVIKNLKQTAKKRNIDNIFKNINTQLKLNAKNTVENITSEIHAAEEELRMHYIHLKQALIQANSENGISDLELILPFLYNNEDITLIALRGTPELNIQLRIQGKVDYDKSEIEKCIKNHSSFIIWVLTHPYIHLHWEANCILNLNNCTISNRNDYTYTMVPNAHWAYYNCFGDNKSIIQKAIAENDFLTVFSKTITAAYQLNIYDITVLNRLIDGLSHDFYCTETFYNEKTQCFMSMQQLRKLFEEETTNAQ